MTPSNVRGVDNDELLAGSGHELVVDEEPRGLAVLEPVGQRNFDRRRHSEYCSAE